MHQTLFHSIPFVCSAAPALALLLSPTSIHNHHPNSVAKDFGLHAVWCSIQTRVTHTHTNGTHARIHNDAISSRINRSFHCLNLLWDYCECLCVCVRVCVVVVVLRRLPGSFFGLCMQAHAWYTVCTVHHRFSVHDEISNRIGSDESNVMHKCRFWFGCYWFLLLCPFAHRVCVMRVSSDTFNGTQFRMNDSFLWPSCSIEFNFQRSNGLDLGKTMMVLANKQRCTNSKNGWFQRDYDSCQGF